MPIVIQYGHLSFVLYLSLLGLISYIALYQIKNPLKYYIIVGSIFLFGSSLAATFIDQLIAGEVLDGWGSAIRVEQLVDQYVLLSAGPDQTFKTDDDVLQTIKIP